MSGNLEADIKERAVTKLIKVIDLNNKTLGKIVSDNRAIIHPLAIANIQRIGITEYATRVLRRNSFERNQLISEIESVKL